MTVQLVVPNPEPKCPRGDRLQEEPSAKNAQGLFPPEACIFVGNLSTKVPTETLAEDLKSVFTRFGACHVKIKQDKKKGLPGAFIQFERVEDASAALASEESTILHDRILRIERAKGRRTACLGLRSLQPITARDVLGALEGRGSLEVYTIEPQQAGYQTWTDIAKVTFAFVDDCRDAIKYFQKDEKYFLHLLDMDGSPLLQGPVQGPGSRPRPYNGHFSLPAATSSRVTTTASTATMNGENMAPRGGYMPTPPNMMNAMPINNDIYPPFFQPPPPFQPHPHGPNGYSLPPPQFIVGPHPVHMGPHQHIDTVGPPPPLPSGGHYMIHGQPIWSSSPPIPPYFPPHMYPQEHGYFGPQPGMNGPPNGYFGPVDNYGPVPVGAAGPMPYVEPWPGHARSSYSPPTVNEKGSNGHFPRNTPAPMQPHNVHASFTPREKVVVDQSSEETVGGCPLNPKTPEKAPRLIRVYHDDDDDDDDDEYPKTGSEKASSINAVVVSVHEITDNDSATEAECRSRSRSRSLSQDQRRTRSQSSDSRSRSRSQSLSGSRSRSVSASGIRQSLSPFSRSPAHSRSSSSDSQKSKKSVRWSENLVMDGSKPPSRSNSTSSTTSSRTCASPTQKPVGTISPTKSAMKSSRTSTSPTQMHVDTVSPTNKTITSSRICTSPTQKPVDTFSPTKKKIEEYVRSEAHGKGLSEVELQEVIESLMEEQAAKAKEQEEQALMAATDEYQPMTGTDPGGSPNGSVAQKKSV
ncbi:uncharacterized protein N7473_009109 [Penicillium subrubescens]|uniref:uncharacterized protein n=1 Tax=Penicillium subrubescens TaxID=1316194 RepID=UPI0025450C13|nr:uncharacterized protein N7473_009109 [Penicillium subrubescens]KAJ5886435.1 hypothetical protein N7473_009109 [Penicillium subrubescens]